MWVNEVLLHCYHTLDFCHAGLAKKTTLLGLDMKIRCLCLEKDRGLGQNYLETMLTVTCVTPNNESCSCHNNYSH